MIDRIIKYIVWKLQEGEWSINKTKIVKLLYLIDIEYYRQYSETLTDFTWIYYYYGPYATEVEDIFKQLRLDTPQEEVKTAKGFKAIIFRSSEEAEYEFNEHVSQQARYVVERILRQWAPEELNPLLSYVYFDTEPMKDAQPGAILDFAGISTALPERKIDESVIRLTGDETEHLSYRLDEYKKKQRNLSEISEKQGKRLPSPKNKAYTNAQAVMNNEERRPLPINIDVIVES